jgi:hypothetical protein
MRSKSYHEYGETQIAVNYYIKLLNWLDKIWCRTFLLKFIVRSYLRQYGFNIFPYALYANNKKQTKTFYLKVIYLEKTPLLLLLLLLLLTAIGFLAGGSVQYTSTKNTNTR